MGVEPKLEYYLTALDKSLGTISVSDRADIITEIKSHILEAQEKDPNKDLASILAALGEPEAVANRYLMERGLKLSKPSKSPMIKWLTIGFLGTFAIGCLFVLVVIWRFTPLISIDEQNERVTLLGGAIDLDGKSESVKFGSGFSISGESRHFDGTKEVDLKKFKEIRIPFNNGKFEIKSSATNQLKWKCKVGGSQGAGSISEDNSVFTVDLSNTGGSKCELELPLGIKTVLEGANGKIDVERPSAELDITMGNGKVAISPDPDKKYKFDMSVVNGTVSAFESSPLKDAIAIRVSLTNGQIKRE
jgi:hypothetical protein